MSFWKKFEKFLNPNVESKKSTNSNVKPAHVDQLTDFSTVLNLEDIEINAVAESKNALLKALADKTTDPETVYGKLLFREKASSTEVGNGVALPHMQDKSIPKLRVIILRLEKPIKWQQGGINLVIAVFIPEKETHFEHVTCLATICRHLLQKGFLRAMRNARSKEDIYKLF